MSWKLILGLVISTWTGKTSLGSFPENYLHWLFSVLRTISWSEGFFLQALHKSPQVCLFFFSSTECDITQGLCSYSQCKLKLKLCLITPGITEWPDLLQSSNVSCHYCFSASPATFTFAFYTVWLASTSYNTLCCFILCLHAHSFECMDESHENSQHPQDEFIWK